MASADIIKVAVRIRPLIDREKAAASSIHWDQKENSIVQIDPVSKRPKTGALQQFHFDSVFGMTAVNRDVYNGVVAPIVESAMRGFNGTIFAYGQTGSGKTHSISGSKDEFGIISLAISDIFDNIERSDRKYCMRMSYLEIYNEVINDLLNGEMDLKIRENQKGEVSVAELREVPVTSFQQVLTAIQSGERRRHYGGTQMNERSSRSHTIFRLIMENMEAQPTNSRESIGDCAVEVSQLNIVDLAGSERADQAGTTGDRLKEGCSINTSLFQLSHVIRKLSEGSTFVNFRDSKLTRILQNSLGGNAKTCIVCTVTPAVLDQTSSTLLFASRAKKICNKPVKNEVLTDEAMMKRYQKEIGELRQRVSELAEQDGLTSLQLDKIEMERLLAQKEEKIAGLQRLIVCSSRLNCPAATQKQKLKSRRETWCPGLSKESLSVTPHRWVSSLGIVPFPAIPESHAAEGSPNGFEAATSPFMLSSNLPGASVCNGVDDNICSSPFSIPNPKPSKRRKSVRSVRFPPSAELCVVAEAEDGVLDSEEKMADGLVEIEGVESRAVESEFDGGEMQQTIAALSSENEELKASLDLVMRENEKMFNQLNDLQESAKAAVPLTLPQCSDGAVDAEQQTEKAAEANAATNTSFPFIGDSPVQNAVTCSSVALQTSFVVTSEEKACGNSFTSAPESESEETSASLAIDRTLEPNCILQELVEKVAPSDSSSEGTLVSPLSTDHADLVASLSAEVQRLNEEVRRYQQQEEERRTVAEQPQAMEQDAATAAQDGQPEAECASDPSTLITAEADAQQHSSDQRVIPSDPTSPYSACKGAKILSTQSSCRSNHTQDNSQLDLSRLLRSFDLSHSPDAPLQISELENVRKRLAEKETEVSELADHMERNLCEMDTLKSDLASASQELSILRKHLELAHTRAAELEERLHISVEVADREMIELKEFHEAELFIAGEAIAELQTKQANDANATAELEELLLKSRDYAADNQAQETLLQEVAQLKTDLANATKRAECAEKDKVDYEWILENEKKRRTKELGQLKQQLTEAQEELAAATAAVQSAALASSESMDSADREERYRVACEQLNSARSEADAAGQKCGQLETELSQCINSNAVIQSELRTCQQQLSEKTQHAARLTKQLAEKENVLEDLEIKHIAVQDMLNTYKAELLQLQVQLQQASFSAAPSEAASISKSDASTCTVDDPVLPTATEAVALAPVLNSACDNAPAHLVSSELSNEAMEAEENLASIQEENAQLLQEIARLNQLAELQNSNTLLLADVSRLTEEAETFRADQFALEERYRRVEANLKAECAALSSRLEQLTAANSEAVKQYQEQIAGLTSRLNAAASEREFQQVCVEQSKRELADLQSENSRLREEAIQQLKESDLTRKRQSVVGDSQDEEKTQLQVQLSQVIAKLEEAEHSKQKAAQVYQQQIDGLQSQLRTAQQVHETVQKSVEALTAAAAELQTQLESKASAFEQLKDEMQRQSAFELELQSQMQELGHRVAEQDAKVDELEAQNAEAEQSSAAADEREATLRGQLALAFEERATLIAQLTQAEQRAAASIEAKNELDKKCRDLEEAKKTLETLRDEQQQRLAADVKAQAKLEEKVKRLTTELEAMRSAQADLLASGEQSALQSEAEFRVLNDQLLALESSKNEAARDFQLQIEALTKQLSKQASGGTTPRRAACNNRGDEQTKEIARLTTALENEKLRLRALQRELDEEKHKKMESTEIDRLIKELAAKTDDADHFRKQKLRLEKLCDDGDQEVVELKQTVDLRDDEIRVLKAELQQSNSALAKAAADSESIFQQRIQPLVSELTSLRSRLQHVSRSYEELKHQYVELEATRKLAVASAALKNAPAPMTKLDRAHPYNLPLNFRRENGNTAAASSVDNEEVKLLRKQLVEATSSYTNLRREIELVRDNSKAELADREHRIAEMERKVQQAQNQLAAANSNNKAATATNGSSIAPSVERVFLLQRELTACQHRIKTLEDDLAVKDEKISQFKQELRLMQESQREDTIVMSNTAASKNFGNLNSAGSLSRSKQRTFSSSTSNLSSASIASASSLQLPSQAYQAPSAHSATGSGIMDQFKIYAQDAHKYQLEKELQTKNRQIAELNRLVENLQQQSQTPSRNVGSTPVKQQLVRDDSEAAGSVRSDQVQRGGSFKRSDGRALKSQTSANGVKAEEKQAAFFESKDKPSCKENRFRAQLSTQSTAATGHYFPPAVSSGSASNTRPPLHAANSGALQPVEDRPDNCLKSNYVPTRPRYEPTPVKEDKRPECNQQ